MKRALYILITGLLIPGWGNQQVHAQVGLDSLTTTLLDSLEQMVRAQQEAQAEERRRQAGQSKFLTDTVSFYLIQRVEELSMELDRNSRFLRTGLDSSRLKAELQQMEENIRLVERVQQISTGRGNLKRQQLLRDGLRREIRRADLLQEELARLNGKLLSNNRRIFLILNDSLMRQFPQDSVLQQRFIAQLSQLSDAWKTERKLQRESLLLLSRFQSRLSALQLRLQSLLYETEDRIRQYERSLLIRNEDFLWKVGPSDYPFRIVEQAQVLLPTVKGVRLYLRHDRNRYWWVSLLAGIAFALWVRVNRRQLVRHEVEWDYEPSYLQGKLPWVALFLGLFFLVLFEPYAPAYFKDVLYIFLFISASPLLLRHLPRSVHWVWYVLVPGLLLMRWFLDIGALSYGERWLVLLFAVLGGFIGLSRHLQAYRNLLRRRQMGLFVVALFTASNLSGALLEVLGWHLLAKTLVYGAYYAVTFGLLLFLLVQLVHEAVLLQVAALRKATALAAFLHSDELQGPLYRVLFVLAVVLWLIATAIAYNIYDFGSGQLSAFLRAERKLGDATFTYGSILVFGAVLWGAAFLSRVIGEFYREDESNPLSTGKGAQGSKLLLVRLGVLILGFFVGLSAAGIPLTNLAIVVGALSVGIGFGLQNVVNNLISGIILAFERPIRVGDTVEVGTVIGKVREIGIRSTKIAAYDGSELIVPNGDLISQQIVNWTLSNNYRRLELFIGVAYGSDVAQVQGIIKQVLHEQQEIFNYPEPSILTHDLSDSSVVFRILFWVRETSSWLQIRSEVIAQIYNQLRAQGVEIPYPKRDVYLHMTEGKKGASTEKGAADRPEEEKKEEK